MTESVQSLNDEERIDVSIIIITYNTRDITIDCIDSVLMQTKDISYEILVVDNASDDGTMQALRMQYHGIDKVRIVENVTNMGFAAANNRAAQMAKGKYLLLLNSDTQFLNNAAKMFFDKAEKEYPEDILGAYLLDRNMKPANSYGAVTTKRRIKIRQMYLYAPFLLRIRRLFPLEYEHIVDADKEVGFITGADLFINRDVYERLSGLDESFFMYCEDEDLGIRAHRMGISSHVVYGPQIVHLDGGSFYEKTADRRRLQIAANERLLKKHFG